MTLCDFHSAPCFKVFWSNLYSVLEFYHLLYFKIQKHVEKYMYYCICYYLAGLLVVTTCNNMPIGESMKKTIYMFITVFFTRLKHIFLAARGPLEQGALGPGLASLCLKAALIDTHINKS